MGLFLFGLAKLHKGSIVLSRSLFENSYIFTLLIFKTMETFKKILRGLGWAILILGTVAVLVFCFSQKRNPGQTQLTNKPDTTITK